MRNKRLAAGAVAATLLIGSVGLAVVNSGVVPDNTVAKKIDEPVIADNEHSFAYGTVQSLYYKINELWRLSINSDLSMETISAISALNSGFNSELLEKAVEVEGEGIIDEYIYAVLAGLDFELYLEDKDAYEAARSGAIYTGEVLTQTKIDEYLNQLNEKTANAQVDEALNSAPEGEVTIPKAVNNRDSAMPEVPTAQSVMPDNPAEAIRRETEAITSHALGIEVE